MRHELTGTLTAALAVTALGLAGCASKPAENHSEHSGPAPAPSPVAATAVPGAAVTKGELRLLSTALPGSERAAGTAWLARYGHGSTVTATVTGLAAGKKYMSHLHAKPCAQDGGGGHFKFDPSGPEQPPNEVHLALVADPSGAATATAESKREVGPEAKSIVVHDADKKMLCADF